MTRKLVTIRQISELTAIKGADFIELAHIDGWQCVVKKGEFKQGDLGVYFEIDSFLPVEDRYEFLRKNSFKRLGDGKEGFRLKTIRLKKQISQGLLLSLATFPELENVSLGDEVTEQLNVVKYETPIPPQLKGKMEGSFPGFIPKTDEERIQNLPDHFLKYRDIDFECTIKLDGTSATYYWRDGKFGVCSRNWELKEDFDNLYWKIAKKYRLDDMLTNFGEERGRSIALQGEIVGEGLGDPTNPEKIKGHMFFLFNIYDIDRGRYLTPEERVELLDLLDGIFAEGKYTVENVPSLGFMNIFKDCPDIKTILDFAINHNGGTSYNPETKREGLVFKSRDKIDGEIVSFKVISNEYLLGTKKKKGMKKKKQVSILTPEQEKIVGELKEFITREKYKESLPEDGFKWEQFRSVVVSFQRDILEKTTDKFDGMEKPAKRTIVSIINKEITKFIKKQLLEDGH
jgi:RNA ligase (TIGR02306 family)